ncbi:MAG TPA: tRNA uridine-5-carboxymethylaminomethyl(34) synthesis GTPase MnmE [Sphingomonas sp.]|uniref:tRNA uridine-5-carboxymethylaminomethyl(34) synthesis GTPase MnmE n=1 Tax=Sphingomonas sp. TaxID=28214 RepID=UPI002BD9F043|nr:tRNA uridine-5-carboxymethylaminomethyl(34) synthesis GTPase MnmE [Sphingomonas sp.]HMI19933.1 tRNA uridine-5-carboxymethylaminomethyl(34) synthesis GTPase MnmE [Sphingomonas sp.]
MTGAARDTIFALSSGALPAGIAVVRVSGPRAADALQALAGRTTEARRAVTATLRDASGENLDRAVVLWLPGPGTATGEDIAEFHLHGGRAVVAAVLAALGALEGLRMAEPGEFTRRAFSNGRLDLAQAEGLADLLSAETEAQRRQALRLAEGGLGKLIGGWRERLLGLAARVEAAIEFAEDEDDVPSLGAAALDDLAYLGTEMQAALDQPPAERLRDGVRIVVAGPTNAGKSSLINILAGREAAIASPVAGTTRDLIEVPVSIAGMPCLLIDSAGLRESGGQVEQIGMARARAAIDSADLILWLGLPGDCPDRARSVLVQAKADLAAKSPAETDVATSTVTGEGLDALRALLQARLRALLPPADAVALNARHRERIDEARREILTAAERGDLLLVAEHLRQARVALDRITGRAGVEDMLDALFGRFCIGK